MNTSKRKPMAAIPLLAPLLGTGTAVLTLAALTTLSACFGSPDYENQYTQEEPLPGPPAPPTTPTIPTITVAPQTTDPCDGGDAAACTTTESNPGFDPDPIGNPAAQNPDPVPWVPPMMPSQKN